MSEPKNRLSFARQHSDSLPGGPSTLDRTQAVRTSFEPARCEYRARELASQSLSEAERRESFMVKRSRPEPVLRPTRSLAFGPDRAAFETRWANEQRAAALPSRADRKAAFKRARGNAEPDKSKDRSH